MSNHLVNLLPGFIDPLRLAEAGQVLKGRVAVADMPRLMTTLELQTPMLGEVDADLAFGVDGQGVRHVRGNLRAELNVMCQRCLQPMILPLQVNIALGMARTLDEAERLPDGYEPLMIDGQSQSLAAIIEDELLLALPVAPMHAAQCMPWVAPGVVPPATLAHPRVSVAPGVMPPATLAHPCASQDAQAEVATEDLPPEGKRRPFAVLAQLKQFQKK